MITNDEILDVLEEVEFLDWKFIAKFREGEDTFGLSIESFCPDNSHPQREPDKIIFEQLLFKRPLSQKHFIQLLWEIINKRLQHEAGEIFKIKGVMPYNEHNEETEQELLHSIFDAKMTIS